MPPAGNDLKVNWHIGKERGDTKADASTMDRIAQAIAIQVADQAIKKQVDWAKGFQKRLPPMVEAEYVRGVKYAAQNLIGTRSQPGSGSQDTFFNAFGGISEASSKADLQAAIRPAGAFPTSFRLATPLTVSRMMTWRNLSTSWMREKGNNRFFLNSGALQARLKAMAKEYVRSTGGVRVNVTYRDGQGRFVVKGSRKITSAKVNIKILPDIPRALLPGLTSGNPTAFDPSMGFERALGIEGLDLEKLRGPDPKIDRGRRHRPLLQPVFTYWTLVRIPAMVYQAMQRASR